MARFTDTARNYRALVGAPVEIALVGTSTRELGVVWSPAPLEELTVTAKTLRKKFRMEKAADRDVVFVLLTGGRIARAEVNPSTLRGYGVVLRENALVEVGGGWARGRRPVLVEFRNRHDGTDEEILAAHVEAADDAVLLELEGVA